HRDLDLADPQALFAGGDLDLIDDVRDALDFGHDPVHGRARLADLLAAMRDMGHVGVDQGLDFPGRLGAALGERTDFGGHHGEAGAVFACAGGLDGGVQRQDVGLEGDAVDHADDVGDAGRVFVHALHGLDHAAHQFPAFPGGGAGAVGQLHGGVARIGGLLDGAGQLFHGTGGLLQAGGGAFGAAGQVGVAGGDLVGC